MISALYVQEGGCYYGISDVDPWPEERDARLYLGPHAVVAHPPCQRWGKLAKVNYARWGGEHNRPGNDGGCFKCALSDVRRWGGVLEHPAQSYAYDAFSLLRPSRMPKHRGWIDISSGDWVCEVWQSAYGHRANKATWLFYHGARRPFDLRWDRPIGEFQVGFEDSKRRGRNKPTLSPAEAAATPLAFRDALLDLARWSLAAVR